MEERIHSKVYYVKETKLHMNTNELQIILVLKGTIKIHKVDEAIELKENEFTFINTKLPYYIESDGAYVLSTLIDLSKFTNIFDKIEYVEFITLDTISHIEGGLKARLDYSIIDFVVKNYLYTDKSYYISEKQFNEEQLVCLLFSQYQLINYNRDFEQYYSSDLIDRYYTIVKYIIDHIHEKIKAPDILEVVYMNQTYFSQFMKKVSGIGFKEFVNYRKLAIVMNEMVHRDDALSDIANEVGITDMKSFYNIFKKYHNTSPALWKKEMTNLKDDYEEVDNEDIIHDYAMQANIMKHNESTFEKLTKYLLICKANNVNLTGMEISINPYLDCKEGEEMYYQPYKYITSALTALNPFHIKLVLNYEFKNLRQEGEKALLLNTLKVCTFRVGLAEMKKWRIIFNVDNIRDFNEAKAFKAQIEKTTSNVNVIISLQVFTK